MHDTSHVKGKPSTAKHPCLGSFLGLELILYCVLISSFWRVTWTFLSTILQLVPHHLLMNDLKSRSQMAMSLARAELALYLGCGCTLDIIITILSFHKNSFHFLLGSTFLKQMTHHDSYLELCPKILACLGCKVIGFDLTLNPECYVKCLLSGKGSSLQDSLRSSEV